MHSTTVLRHPIFKGFHIQLFYILIIRNVSDCLLNFALDPLLCYFFVPIASNVHILPIHPKILYLSIVFIHISL